MARYASLIPFGSGVFYPRQCAPITEVGAVGSFGLVKLQQNGKRWCRKYFSEAEFDAFYHSPQFSAERFLSHFPHPNVLWIINLGRVRHDEYCVDYRECYEDLYVMLMREKRMHDTRALEYMHQIASGVQHCHTLQLVLRNLKMQRIFFTSADHTTLAIGDFTDAELVPTRHCFVHDQKGSPVYVAPEVIACQPYDPFAADIWSMGVLFYFLLMGRYPFQASTPTELIKKITSATPDFSTASPRVSNTAKSLVGAMLSKLPEERPTADEVLNDACFINMLGVIDTSDMLDTDVSDQVVPHVECPVNA